MLNIFFSFRFYFRVVQTASTVHRGPETCCNPECRSDREVPSPQLPPCRHRTLGTCNPGQQTLSMHLAHPLKLSHTLFVCPALVPPCRPPPLAPSSCHELLGPFGHMQENQLLGVSAPSNWLSANDQQARGATTRSFCQQSGRALRCD